MTVTYTHEVADCKGFGNFWRLLFRWVAGSVYKLVWPEPTTYLLMYALFSILYRVVFDEYEGGETFEQVSLYCHHFSDLIPVSFVLGFYVSIVLQRWWAQYESLPWPDSLALIVSTSIHGHDNRGRLMRRTIMRYVNLTFTLTLTMITPRAKKRFPTLEHLVDSGLMTAGERKILEAIQDKAPHPVYYLPLVWAGGVVARARKEGRIRDDFALKTIIDEINRLRGLCGGLLSYDWISIPLVYTQVVTLAVYSFFLATLMGRQFLDPAMKYPNNLIDFYFPIFTLLQFFFYMGWLKVAETLVNPFGEDDDDFEVNWLIDRNIQVSFLIVDEMHNEHPELVQDMYWDDVYPQELPYTFASEQYRRDPPMGSTANFEIPEAEQEILPVLDEEPEEGDDEWWPLEASTPPSPSPSPEPNLPPLLLPQAEAGKGTPTYKRRGSLRSLGSSLHSARKSSILNFFHQRFHKPEMPSRTGSSSRGLNRSASRASAGSGLTASRFNVARNNTNASSLQSEAYGLSSESLNVDSRNSPRLHFGRHASQDEDGAILIKIKRRDKDGEELSGSAEELVKHENAEEEEMEEKSKKKSREERRVESGRRG
ncbi:bestrophin-4-like [Penaeus japonicus]|uniref:bestrophin-4-like n=1 Tax=Penaeus japonicus TaxID=27405 RepID=UPI001C70BF79|nr:bestrophin-4-like [Penaeus japonicus]XP_042889213.1 bestrophin-4-like [Penaeus japonicus]